MRSSNEGVENRHRPWLFAFTGTPLSSGLKGLEAWAMLQYEHIAKRVGWDKEPGLKMVNKDWFADVEGLFRHFERLEFNTPGIQRNAYETRSEGWPFSEDVHDPSLRFYEDRRRAVG